MAAYKLTDIQKKHLQEILSDPFFAREQEESQKSTDPHGREAKTQINKNVTQKLREAETNFSPQAARELREAPGALEILRSRLALKKVQNNPVFPAQSVKSSLPFAQPSQSDSGEWNSAREQALEMNAEATLNLANRALRDSGLSSYAQKQKGYELNDLFEQAKDPLHYQEGIDGMNAFIDSVYPMEPQKRNLVMQGESGSTRTMERDYRDGLDDESIYLPSRRIDTDRADDLAQSFEIGRAHV